MQQFGYSYYPYVAKNDPPTTFPVMPYFKWEIKSKKVVLVLKSMAKHFFLDF